MQFSPPGGMIRSFNFHLNHLPTKFSCVRFLMAYCFHLQSLEDCSRHSGYLFHPQKQPSANSHTFTNVCNQGQSVHKHLWFSCSYLSLIPRISFFTLHKSLGTRLVLSTYSIVTKESLDSLVSRPSLSFSLLGICLTVLQAKRSWARAQERGQSLGFTDLSVPVYSVQILQQFCVPNLHQMCQILSGMSKWYGG